MQGSGIVLACFTNIVSASNVNNEFVIIKVTIDDEVVLWACNSFCNGFVYNQGVGKESESYGIDFKIVTGPDFYWDTINDWDVTCTKSTEDVIFVLDLPIIFNESLKIQTYSFCVDTSKPRKYKVYVRYKLDE